MRTTITLISTGRRSGQRREATLYAWSDGERLVIVGSAGGRARHPAWVANLRANPAASVRRGRREERVTATEVTGGPERERLWRLVTEAFPLYETYQRRTKRTIPLFTLQRVEDGRAT